MPLLRTQERLNLPLPNATQGEQHPQPPVGLLDKPRGSLHLHRRLHPLRLVQIQASAQAGDEVAVARARLSLVGAEMGPDGGGGRLVLWEVDGLVRLGKQVALTGVGGRTFRGIGMGWLAWRCGEDSTTWCTAGGARQWPLESCRALVTEVAWSVLREGCGGLVGGRETAERLNIVRWKTAASHEVDGRHRGGISLANEKPGLTGSPLLVFIRRSWWASTALVFKT
jgi:hypothetical protein